MRVRSQKGKDESMTESEIKQVARDWSQRLCTEGIPHVLIGSAAMLLCGCDHGRKAFKDVDFLVPENKAQGVKDLLAQDGFTVGKNRNYEKDGITIGIATPRTHSGLPCPTDKSVGSGIDGVWVMNLDGLIETKRLAIISQMQKLKKRGGYRRHRAKSVEKSLRDFCAICHARDQAIQGSK
jgi:hypothetical protein